MWIIKPNYNKHQTCFYCGKNKAIADKENTTTLYKIVDRGKFMLSVNYLKIDIGIPRCEECYKRHKKAGKPTCLIFLIGIIIGIGLCFIYDLPFLKFSSEPSEWFGTIAVLATIVLMWFIACIMVGSLIRIIINAFMKGTKDEENNENYPPIKKLLDIGFMSQKPDAAAHYGKTLDFDKTILENTFKSITDENNCIIRRGQ